MDTTSREVVNAIPTGGAQPNQIAIDVDLAAWNITIEKLTLRETGELIRSLLRAQRSDRPNREQRMLLAIFTRQPAEGVL